jgi:hypothetical protein
VGKRSVKTSTGDISVADDAMGDWDFEGTDDGRGKRWVLREHARQRLEVIASEVPKEDISALRDVEGDAVRPLRGWAAWAQKVSYGWVGTAGDIEFNKQL